MPQEYISPEDVRGQQSINLHTSVIDFLLYFKANFLVELDQTTFVLFDDYIISITFD